MNVSRVENLKKVISIIFFIAVVGFLAYIIGIYAISEINKKKNQGIGLMYGNVSMEACPEGKEEAALKAVPFNHRMYIEENHMTQVA